MRVREKQVKTDNDKMSIMTDNEIERLRCVLSDNLMFVQTHFLKCNSHVIGILLPGCALGYGRGCGTVCVTVVVVVVEVWSLFHDRSFDSRLLTGQVWEQHSVE